jgi:glutamate/tyrosine decarboxylase-like PLP-dependent enzyme
MDIDDIQKLLESRLGSVNPRLLSWVFDKAKKIPAVRKKLDAEYEVLLADLADTIKPYRGRFESVPRLPAQGRDRAAILDEMRQMKALEQNKWKDGFVSGAVYHGDEEHIEFLNEAYGINSQANPLHSDLWPSVVKFESEIVSMTANMLGAQTANAAKPADEHVVGAVSSGGTESIMLAMKAYRDWARSKKKIASPQMVVPSTAHAAFDKASQYFGIEMIKVPVGEDGRADIAATKKAIGRNTIVVVGSAPSFPHGVIDPIEELAALAQAKGIGCHVDSCLGGFVLPWAKKLDYPVPAFDFCVPGVTSMSADTHKYGYAAKGTSVVLYRGKTLRHFQFYTVEDWPGGLYFSPTFAGSRPGALSAACWAAMVSMGEQGYLDATKAILETGSRIKQGIKEIEGLKVIGDPLWVIAFRSDDVDVYRVMDTMTERNWSLNGLHKPSCVHIAVTLRHTKPGVADRFLADLQAATQHVRDNPSEKGGMAPVYGVAASVPVRGMVSDLLTKYMDLLYEV